MTEPPIRRALLSVWDKTGLVEFARELAGMGVELVSTGGTASALREAGLQVTDVAAVTGAPGILDGRVKTLHPAVHGGILARRDVEAHMATIEALDIPPIDLVAVNLYPFEATVAEGADYEATVEMIDVGGPAMIRAAAKNHASVTVVVDPQDYGSVLEAISAHERRTTPQLRQRLAAKAFGRTAAYDAAIASWFTAQSGELLPEHLIIAARRVQLSRYGENPHQRAAFYVTGEAAPGVATAAQVQGKALSFNNVADADAAFELACEFEQAAVAIIKHANPCGVAVGNDLAEIYARALACDPISAYGGIIAFNRPLDRAVAEQIVQIFTEVVIAPDADAAARQVLAAKPNLRLLLTGALLPNQPGELRLRSVSAGLLVQERDVGVLEEDQLKVVTARAPTPGEIVDLRFAFAACKHVKSNAIVFAKEGATVGIGAGQMSRLDSVKIAVAKANEAATLSGEAGARLKGSVLASDAFFPFADGLQAALDAGATAAIQPGGSLRDEEVIAAADRAGAAMVFTGIRHFRH
jgi:phosphoribosylaminoimidazolecarboxamide formyltransferase / IMP cyclohydrolase